MNKTIATETGPGSSPISPVYCLYNGFMLGHFMHQFHLSYTTEDHPTLSRRVNEFLGAIGIEHEIPSSHEEYTRYVNEPGHESWLEQLYRINLLLGKAVFLGMASSEFFMRAALGRPPRESQYEKLVRTSEDIGVRQAVFDKLAAELPQNPEHEDVQVSDYLSVTLRYLMLLLRLVERDENTAFVAMPFDEPFPSRFGSFYAPAASACGCHAIRAWGGLAAETFSNMLGTLISKCGRMIADITGLNSNVLYEVGLGYGHGLDVALVCESDKADVPANLGEFMVRPYTPRNEGWEKDAISGVGLVFSLLRLGRDLIDEDGLHRPLEQLLGGANPEEDAQ